MPHPPAQPIEHRVDAGGGAFGTVQQPGGLVRSLRSQKNLVQFPRSQSPTDQIFDVFRGIRSRDRLEIAQTGSMR
jgi:hypothetical protein